MPFLKKNISLNLNQMYQKHIPIRRDSTSIGPSRLSKCPFVKQRYSFIEAKNSFPRIIWINSFILDKQGALNLREIQLSL